MSQTRQAILRRAGERGELLGSVLFSAVLILGIFLQVIYLTKDLGWRVDLTQEKLYSLTGSTQKVLSRLELPLVIEAYFSDKVPGSHKVDRQKISNMLDEYEQMGGGKVKVLYLDPLEDEGIREKASRLGITEAQATDLKDDSIQAVRFYQGLRVRYGGDKQKVLPLVQNANTIETQLTPVIRELVTERKPKVGILVRPETPDRMMMMMQRQQTPGYTLIERVLRGRYEIASIDMSQGQVLPEDLDILVVVKPKDLTDWEKYCIDQHLMGGGNLMVFAEAADYSIDQFASFYRQPFQIDKPDSALIWKKQLAAYGVDYSDRIVVDMLSDTWDIALSVVQGAGGSQAVRQMYKPYWFKALDYPWKSLASRLASTSDAVQELEKRLERGINTKHPTLNGMKAVSFFWPTEVGLTDPLPDGLTGNVLVRSSPLGLSEEPPQSTAPSQTMANLRARVGKEERRNVPLIVAVQGKFTSAWKGIDMPKRPLPETDKQGGLLAGGQGQGQETESKEAAKGQEAKGQGPEAGQEKPGQEKPGQETGAPPAQDPKADPKAAAEAGQQKQDGVKDAGQVGPPLPEDAKEAEEDEKNKLPPRKDAAEKESRIIVVGDSTMLRDDFLQGLPPFGMPRSTGGLEFYQNALDWLALDTDLVELRNKRDVDRRLVFLEPDPNSKMSYDEVKATVASRKKWLRWINILGPVVVLLAFGLFLWSKRSSEKRSFLAGQQR